MGELDKPKNQVKESFTIPLEPYNITISTYNNGSVSVMSDIPTDMAPPCTATAIKTIENMVLEHYSAGVDVLDTFYVQGLERILHTVCRTPAAEFWGLETE